MPGEPLDEIYVQARRVLLDGLEAFGPHRDAVILVGAQAIYLHTGGSIAKASPWTSWCQKRPPGLAADDQFASTHMTARLRDES